MPVIETTSGEIATPEQYRAEMAATVKEAAAEKEDATQDEARCVAELQRINRIIAAAKSDRIRLPQEELARLTQLAEATMRQKTNAQARIAAASARLAIAMQCEQDASRHLALVGQAAGTWYNPGASA